MASRFLTDRYERIISTFHPADFLVGWIRGRTLALACANPRKGSESWERRGIPLSGPSPSKYFADLPLSPLLRKSAPFLLLWPSEWCFGSLLRLPSSVTASERDMAISVEMEPLLPWPIEEVAFAFDTDTSIRENTSTVYAWATPARPLQEILGFLQNEDLDPRWIFPESFFLSRLLSEETRRLPAPEGLSGLVSGDAHRTLCLLSKGDHVKGETAILHEGDEGLSLREKRLADHLLFFLSSGLSPEILYRAGDLPSSPLVDRLTTPLSGTRTFRFPNGFDGWRLSRDLSRDHSTALSFRKGALSWQGDMAEQKSGLRVLFILSAFLVLVLILDAGVHLSRMNHRIESAREALDRAAAQALPGHRIVEPVTQLNSELLSLGRQKNLLSRGPDIIRIMKNLTKAPPEGVPFEMVSLVVTKHFFTVSGKTDSFKSVDRIKKALSASGHMGKLTIQSAGLDIDRKTVTFRIRGQHD